MVERIRQVGEEQQRQEVHAERVRRLEKANRRITQRINLFQEILIPDTVKNIRRIRIVLGDAEMSAVVRSKIAKSLHEKKRRKAGGMP
jgi:V/A-type H+-transporting ATPase subunit D